MIVASQEFQSNFKQWLENKLGTEFSDKSVFMGNVENNEILGVVGFDRYTGGNIEIYMAGDSEKWITRLFIKLVFSYVFNQLGCVRCTGLVDADNEPALSIDKRLGFIQEGIMRQANDGKDVIVMGMLKTECRWI